MKQRLRGVRRCLRGHNMKKYSTTSRVLCNKFPSLNILLQIVFFRPATPIHGLNRAPLKFITTTLNQSTSAQPPSHPHTRRHQSGQLVYVPSPRVCFKSQRSRVRYPVRPHTFVSPSADPSRAGVGFWRKYYTRYWLTT